MLSGAAVGIDPDTPCGFMFKHKSSLTVQFSFVPLCFKASCILKVKIFLDSQLGAGSQHCTMHLKPLMRTSSCPPLSLSG